MASNRNYKIALTGTFSALVIVIGCIPQLGYISIPLPIFPIAFTTQHIPVILAAIFGGLVPGMITGATFGIVSCIRCLMNPVGLNYFICNPCVSVLPRICIGIVTWAVFKGVKKIPHMPKSAAGVIAGYAGSFTNTLLFFAAIYLIYFNTPEIAGFVSKINDKLGELSMFKNFSTRAVAWIATIVVYGPGAFTEATAAAVLSGTVLGTISAAKHGKSKLSVMAEEDCDKK